MKKIINNFLSIFSLATRIPHPFKYEFSSERIDFWLPVIGLFSGLTLTLGYLLARAFFTQTILLVLFALLADYLFINLFHLDGLIDTADALGPVCTKEKRHEILKDPRIGTFGAFAAIMILAFKASALFFLTDQTFILHKEFIPKLFLLAAFLSPVAARFSAVLVPLLCKPAKKEGLGALSKDSKLIYAFSGFCIALIPAFIIALVYFNILVFLSLTVLVLICAFLVACMTSLIFKHLFLGYTGDSLGFAIEITSSLSFLTILAFM